MIQFNLLPDVKLEYIKAERTKKLVISISVLAGSVAFAAFLLLFISVNVLQKKNINDLNADIKAGTSEITKTPNVDKILTIQSQLNSLTSLHDQKPMASRLFGYIDQVTPSSVTISSISTDFTAHTITIVGGAPSLDAVNTFVDTLKFTTFTTDKTTTEAKSFSGVVLSSFSRNKTEAGYTINLTYDPLIFDATSKVNLIVPNTITTRSVTEQPSVFKQTESAQ